MGALRIQGITVEIGGDTTKLTAALKGVNGEIRTTQSQLRDVERLLKLDPGNTELLAQKHRLLAEAVRETKEKLETLKAAASSNATTNADGSMRDLSAILADCRTAFGGLSESEKAAAAEALVGKNAMSGFLALMNAAPADIEKVSSAIANCDGKSAEMAATMQDNLAGQLTILKSQLEELAISFGEILMPAIRQIVTWVQGFVDKLNGMDEGTKNTIVTIGLLAAAIGPVLITIGKVVSAVGSIMTFIPTLIGGISSIGGGLSALWGILAANPVTLVIAAIAALIAIFVALWNNCEGFREFWINLWNVIKDAAIAVWNGLKDFFPTSGMPSPGRRRLSGTV